MTTPFTIAAGGVSLPIDVFNTPGLLSSIQLGVTGRTYNYNPTLGTVTITQSGSSIVVPIQTGLTLISSSGYAYVIAFSQNQYMVNGQPMFPYNASIAPAPASYPLLTAPQMFTVGGNFYTFDQDSAGDYLTVTGNGQTYPVNPYQFSINGQVYILNTSVQPNKSSAAATSHHDLRQHAVRHRRCAVHDRAQGRLAERSHHSGQFNITQGNVIVIENYVYELER